MNNRIETENGWSPDLVPSAKEMVIQAGTDVVRQGNWGRRFYSQALNGLVTADVLASNILNNNLASSESIQDQIVLNQIPPILERVDKNEAIMLSIASLASLIGTGFLVLRRRREAKRNQNYIHQRRSLAYQDRIYNEQVERERKASVEDPIWNEDLNKRIRSNRLADHKRRQPKRRRWFKL